MGSMAKEALRKNNLLVPFEIENIPAEYREYYAIKRNNLFATIQGFPDLWRYYVLLDRIWLREFTDLKPARDAARLFPLLLYFNSHAKIRVSIELAFSGCIAEARSILRDAVECVAHAHRMMGDPELQKVWLSKNEEEQAFEAAFVKHKKEGLFKGLGELHKAWGDLSELGSHATVNSMCDRFVQVESGDDVEWKLNYCGVEPRIWAISLFSMLLTCFTMERTMFSDYESRLKLDDRLVQMRAEFEHYKERLRRRMISRYNLTPPESLIYKV